MAFLFLDAIAPFLGAFSTLFFTLSPWALTIYLGAFAGFLLYIGASDILPEAHSQNSSLKLIGLTILGVVLVFLSATFIKAFSVKRTRSIFFQPCQMFFSPITFMLFKIIPRIFLVII